MPWHGLEEDEPVEECKLLSGGFATLLQVLLGLIALSVLVVKRYNEVPQRPLTVWAFDASKQLVGAGFAHVANLLVAILLYQYQNGPSAELAAEAAGVDQCAFYFVNFTMDTTVGVVLNWLFLELVSSLALRCAWHALTTPGDYGDPPRLAVWTKQLLAWVLVIFATKLVIALVIVLCEKPLAALALWLFAPLRAHPRTELAIVMIACPCLMNALQFWVQDSFLKKDARAEHVLAATRSPDKRELRDQALAGAAAANGTGRTPKLKSPKFVIDDEDEDEDDGDAPSDTASDSTAAAATPSATTRRTGSAAGEVV